MQLVVRSEKAMPLQSLAAISCKAHKKQEMRYELRQFPSATCVQNFSRRGDALAALMDAIVVRKWHGGMRGAAVYEYYHHEEHRHRHQNHSNNDVTRVRKKRLKRKWFFRTLGTALPIGFEMLERVRSAKDRKKFVLHVHNYENWRTQPVYVRQEPYVGNSKWLHCYRLAHWLLNAPHSHVRDAAKRLGYSWTDRWLQRRSRLVAQLYKYAIECSERMCRMQLPSKTHIFSFESRNLHLRVYAPAAYQRV